jgi:hypothetical protein
MDPLARRLCLMGAAALALVLLTAFTGQGVAVQVDLASVFSRVAYGAVSLAGAALLWLGKKGLDSLSRLEQQVGHASKQLSTISHELFGATGNNGMRSDLKETKQLVQRHSEVLVVLADRAHINFPKDGH